MENNTNKKEVPIKPHGYHIAHLNAQSMSNKFTNIYFLLKTKHIDILSINETWLTEIHPNDSFNFDGYKIHRLDRSSRGGGVMLLITNKLKSFTENTIMNSSLELIHVSVDIPFSKSINIISFYKPPTALPTDFFNSLTYFL